MGSNRKTRSPLLETEDLESAVELEAGDPPAAAGLLGAPVSMYEEVDREESRDGRYPKEEVPPPPSGS